MARTNAKIVKAIRERSQWMCERCKKIAGEDEWGVNPVRIGADPHHLLEGSTKSQTETVENVLWICRKCHNHLHHHKGQKENHGYKLDYQSWLLQTHTMEETKELMGGKMMLDEHGNIPTDREPFWLKEGL